MSFFCSNEKHVVERDVVSVLKIGSFLPSQENSLVQVVEEIGTSIPGAMDLFGIKTYLVPTILVTCVAVSEF